MRQSYDRPVANDTYHILRTARKYIGTKEGKGKKNNPTVVGWIREFGRNLRSRFARNNDSTAWCAIFVSKVLEECGYRPTYHALAASYVRWGKPSKFTPGAVVVIQRRRKGADPRTGSRAGNHVALLEKITKHYIVLTGGNQRNMVRTSWYPRSAYAILAVRKPSEL